jgi:hypothetical protein
MLYGSCLREPLARPWVHHRQTVLGANLLPRFYCHIVRHGALYEDVGGLLAEDDTEALAIGRAIAKLFLEDDPSAISSVMIIKDEFGRVLVEATLGELSSTVQ